MIALGQIRALLREEFRNKTNSFSKYFDNYQSLEEPKKEILFEIRKIICEAISDGDAPSYDIIKDDETLNVFITTVDKNPKAHKNIADNIRLHKQRIENEPKNINKTISVTIYTKAGHPQSGIID